MQKVIGIVGSGRKNSNSRKLIEIALETMKRNGFEIELIDVLDLNFSGCIECNECRKTGECAIADDLTPIYEKLVRTDGIIISAPVYFYSLPGQIKLLVDRFQALWARRYVLNIQPDKRRFGGLISVAGSNGNKVFNGVLLPIKYFYISQGIDFIEPLLFRGFDKNPEDISEEMLAEVREWANDFAGKMSGIDN